MISSTDWKDLVATGRMLTLCDEIKDLLPDEFKSVLNPEVTSFAGCLEELIMGLPKDREEAVREIERKFELIQAVTTEIVSTGSCSGNGGAGIVKPAQEAEDDNNERVLSDEQKEDIKNCDAGHVYNPKRD